MTSTAPGRRGQRAPRRRPPSQGGGALLRDLDRLLSEETGLPVEWREVGSLRVASSDERWLEIQRLATQARSQGFDLDLVSPSDAVDKPCSCLGGCTYVRVYVM